MPLVINSLGVNTHACTQAHTHTNTHTKHTYQPSRQSDFMKPDLKRKIIPVVQSSKLRQPKY